jgi:uncharacterized protein (TIGR00255 family)
MIQSMTGYGAAEHVENGVSYALEIRSVNHRYLKLSIKVPEQLQFLETDIDRQVRKRIARGSVAYTLRVRGEGETDVRPLNVGALQRYVDQMLQVQLPEQVKATIDLAAIAALPGVCETPDLDDDARKREGDVVATLTDCAIDALIDMRREEGKALYDELRQCCDQMRTLLADIGSRAPKVVDEYHDRLSSRVETLLQSGGFELEEEGLMREVAIYAERCDISEELARLASHLDQTVQLCQRDEQVGRTLDFLTQEMLREANTIASKSNDTAIARAVVQIKGMIDRVREQVQNVE